ncbi:UNVERIFIED_CONTAM: hypothetical protein Slati_4296200 [Sesamum latifolium]|uniref:MULE transposase domain-containing protein n=1 Tax=Sesamum latifolium TaxID=2727402 RepID=A0AAW2TET5_9LAMI
MRAKNQGSKVILRRQEGSDPVVFDRLYYSLNALKLGFWGVCRPIIGLDGCFLKTIYEGQLVIAVERYDNDNMIPIALDVVQVENRENWSWFISELLEDIRGLGTDRWSFISYRHKGLVEALRELAPGSEHRLPLQQTDKNSELIWRRLQRLIKRRLEIRRQRLNGSGQTYYYNAGADQNKIDDPFIKQKGLVVWEAEFEIYQFTKRFVVDLDRRHVHVTKVAKTVGGGPQSHVVKPDVGDLQR